MEGKNANMFMVVDDHPVVRQLLVMNLRNMGYEHVVEAASAEDAIKQLKECAVNLVISDWHMPGMSGLDLLAYMRAEPAYQDLPFMLVTGEADSESVATAIATGVDDILIKPFTPNTLHEKIATLLQKGRFVSSAPRRQQVALDEDKIMARGARGGMPTVLVVDDVPANIDFIAAMLSDEYRVLAATNGSKALQLAHAEPPPDLILLDIVMPEMDGMQVCRLLKEDPRTEVIPIIFLTVKTDVDDIAAGLEAGAVDYVTKPANPKVLKARVRTQLSLKRAQDELREQVDTLLENARLREDVERMTRHDLKNPLAAIINSAELLLEGEDAGIDQTKWIEVIRDSAYDMLSMIDHSLDLYRMETGKYTLKPELFNVVAVARKAANAVGGIARLQGNEIVFDVPNECVAQGEELLCYSMLGNLIKNAIEASPKQGVVSLTIHCGEHVDIAIHNQGQIPAEIQQRFFDKYVTSGKDSGVGIGTYSAKLMVEVQGGSISFVSSATAGTTLNVQLPRGK